MSKQTKGSICIVVPYFGKFPNYFPIWLESCAANPGLNWLIFTDVEDFYDYPSNVRVVKFSLEQVRNLAMDVLRRDLGIWDEIQLQKPHKLCDYRPLFGKIFGEWLSEFEFWGYGDIDLVYGQILNQITPEVLEGNDKILAWGHLSFIKNSVTTEKVIEEFVKQEAVKQGMLLSNRNYVFDEWHGALNINQWFTDKGLKIYEGAAFMDINPGSRRMKRMVWKKDLWVFESEKLANLVIWNQGELWRYYFTSNGGLLQQEELIYVHLKERPMRLELNLNDFVNHFERKAVAIHPDVFKWAKINREKPQPDLLLLYKKASEPLMVFLKRRYRRRKKNLMHKIKVMLGSVK